MDYLNGYLSGDYAYVDPWQHLHCGTEYAGLDGDFVDGQWSKIYVYALAILDGDHWTTVEHETLEHVYAWTWRRRSRSTCWRWRQGAVREVADTEFQR